MSPINTASSVKRMKFREQNKRNAMKVTRIMKQVARLSRDKRRRKQVREEDETFLKVEEEVREEQVEEDETLAPFLKVEEDETFLKVEEDETLVPKRAVKRRRTPLVRIKRKPGHRTLSSEKFEIFEGENEYDPVIVRPTLVEPIEPKTFKIETCCRQLGSKQDYVASVTLDEDCHIIAAFDGHGQDYAIESIRTMDLAHHFSQENPSLSIQKEINAQTILPYARLRSGSTMTYSKVSRNRDTNEVTIGVHWVGDSPAWVFVNDQLVWDNTERLHKICNPNEAEIVKGYVNSILPSNSGFKLISSEEIASHKGSYCQFDRGVKLAMSRSLGHDNVTPILTESHTIQACNTDKVRVVVASDGLGDMLDAAKIPEDLEMLKTANAEQLVEYVEARWKKEWNYHGTRVSFPPRDYDDTSCAIIDL